MLIFRKNKEQNAIELTVSGYTAKVIWTDEGLRIDAPKDIKIKRYFEPEAFLKRENNGKDKNGNR